MLLGSGSYGTVAVFNGMAVKKFNRLCDIIQETCALKYLNDCEYVVKYIGVDFDKLELYMTLHDTSLRKWMQQNAYDSGSLYAKKAHKICHDVLLGLSELHDRGLVHGDIKPGNILINFEDKKTSDNLPLAVLGDCGFVSVAKYAKVYSTARNYKDPIVKPQSSHDMYSFGICFLELVCNINLPHKITYSLLYNIVDKNVNNKDYKKILFALFDPEHNKRPTARQILKSLYNVIPKKHVNIPKFPKIGPNKKYSIVYNMIISACKQYDLNRAKKIYYSLLGFYEENNIDPTDHVYYCSAALMISSCLFSNKSSHFAVEHATILCKKFKTIGRNECSKYDIYKSIDRLINSEIFLYGIFSPSLQ